MTHQLLRSDVPSRVRAQRVERRSAEAAATGLRSAPVGSCNLQLSTASAHLPGPCPAKPTSPKHAIWRSTMRTKHLCTAAQSSSARTCSSSGRQPASAAPATPIASSAAGASNESASAIASSPKRTRSWPRAQSSREAVSPSACEATCSMSPPSNAAQASLGVSSGKPSARLYASAATQTRAWVGARQQGPFELAEGCRLLIRAYQSGGGS